MWEEISAPRSADLPVCLFSICGSPHRCYISTGGSGTLLVFINSIFNVLTFLYLYHVEEKGSLSLFIVFVVACLCAFFMCFFAVFNESLHHLSGSMSGVVYSLISMSAAVSETIWL